MHRIEQEPTHEPSRPLNHGEIAAACVVAALGVVLVWEGLNYPFGSPTRMGPGFFPVVLGVILFGFGAMLVVEVMHLARLPIDFRLRPFILTIVGLLAFALLLDRFGLIPAAVVLVGLSALAERPVRPLAIAGVAIAVAAIGYLVFLRGLGLQIDAIRW